MRRFRCLVCRIPWLLQSDDGTEFVAVDIDAKDVPQPRLS
jgi:hypothetical protein